MKAKITFFPLGNADTTLIQITDTGKTILWDYANTKTSDKDDKRCDLPAELNKRVPKDFDVVCFTHADEDHIKGFSEYFYLEHAEKYQKGSRKKIKELWVPAAIIVDTENKNDWDGILKAEARHRLKKGEGIKVFSKPDKLKDWLAKNDVDFESVKHLIVDAGTLVPGWKKETDGIEFFAHAPFMGHVDDTTIIDRNDSGILVQIAFSNKVATKFILGADGLAETWSDIVKITKFHKNESRLEWDIFHLSHHCSYLSINAQEKGKTKTEPGDKHIEWLYETQAHNNCLIISPSDIIPSIDTTQPPHFQTFNYYKEDVVQTKKGTIVVTMEYPDKKDPKPYEIEIIDTGWRKVLTDEEKKQGAQEIAKTSVMSGNWGHE